LLIERVEAREVRGGGAIIGRKPKASAIPKGPLVLHKLVDSNANVVVRRLSVCRRLGHPLVIRGLSLDARRSAGPGRLGPGPAPLGYRWDTSGIQRYPAVSSGIQQYPLEYIA
jgi:hypothetical protein